MAVLGKPLPMLALVTAGLGLNLRASVLLGPHLHDRFGVAPGWHLALIGLPVLVAALIRVPVGVLTDRYGTRVMFPAVSLVAAASAIAVGLAGSLPAVVAAGAAAGSASSAFVVGAAFVSRVFPYGRRGRALGVFGLGVALAALLSAASWYLDREGRIAALVLGVLLVLVAGLVPVVVREPAPAGHEGSLLRDCAALIRLASTSSVTLLYVVALSGMVSVAVFLPIYLATALRFDWFDAAAITGTLVVVAAAARLAGGWRADRRPVAELLVTCYGIAAGLCVVVAVAPWRWLTVAAIAGAAICDGVAGGTLLALIGKAARPHNAGAVLGATGGAGSLGALLPPLLLAGVHRLTGSYTAGWPVLAAVLLAAALYVRARGLHVGLGLAVGFRPEPGPTATTVAVLGEPDTRVGAAAVVAELAELATSDELVIVFGEEEGRFGVHEGRFGVSEGRFGVADGRFGVADGRFRVAGGRFGVAESRRPGLSAGELAAGLRARLPRHRVVVIRVTEHPELLGRDALVLGEHMESGAVAIGVAPAAGLRDIAADLAIYLQADRVLTVTYDPAAGTALRPVS